MFTSPTGDGTAILHGHPRKGAEKTACPLSLSARLTCPLGLRAYRESLWPALHALKTPTVLQITNIAGTISFCLVSLVSSQA